MYDLFVIGGGSGGVRAARMAANRGLNVVIAEERHWGGTCVNVGCVPKKLFVYAGIFAHEFKDAKHYGWQLPPLDELLENFDWQKLVSNKNREISRLNSIYINMLNNAGVTMLNGRAKITGANSVEVKGEIYQAKHILITSGTMPWKPQIEGAEYTITSDDAFFLESLPSRMTIVGAGYIALEFACIFNALGVDVTVIYRGSELLRNFDPHIRSEVTENLQRNGIAIKFNTNISAIRKKDSELVCELKEGGKYATDSVFYAIGRKPNIENLFAEGSGPAFDERGFIAVDEHFQTSSPGVYALGDIIGRVELTPVAIAEAMQLIDYIKTGTNTVLDYSKIATAVFVMPEVAQVGLNEDQIKQQGIKADVYLSKFKYLKHTLTDSEEKVLMKLLVDSSSGEVLGAHMVGPHSAEMMQGIAIAVNAGLTKQQFDATVGIHPSIAEEWVTMREPSYSV